MTDHHGKDEEHTQDSVADEPGANTVEKSEEMGGGYGGPAPVNPEDEKA